jgi:hypothetical protein
MLWWRRLDSNQRTLCGQIYSLLPLTTRPPLLRQARNYSTGFGGRNRAREHASAPRSAPGPRPPIARPPGKSGMHCAALHRRKRRPIQNQPKATALPVREFAKRRQPDAPSLRRPGATSDSAQQAFQLHTNLGMLPGVSIGDIRSATLAGSRPLGKPPVQIGSKVALSIVTVASYWLLHRTERLGLQPD